MAKMKEVFLEQAIRRGGKRIEPKKVIKLPTNEANRLIDLDVAKDPEEMEDESGSELVAVERYEAMKEKVEELQKELDAASKEDNGLPAIDKLKVAALRKVASELDINDYSDMKKDELVEAIAKEL